MFLLTAILWLLLQLKWFNIHLLLLGSEVRMALALPGIRLVPESVRMWDGTE